MRTLGAFSLDGKVAIVTGASSGLGVAMSTPTLAARSGQASRG